MSSPGTKWHRFDKGPSTIEATQLNQPFEQERWFREPLRMKPPETACRQCGTKTFKLVCPNCWPIQTVAVTCATCGHVRGYLDENTPGRMFEDGSRREVPEREMVIRHRVAHRTYQPDEQRELAIQGLKQGIELAQVAEDLGLTPEYVHAIGVNEGLVKPSMAENVAALANEGKTPLEIASKLGITRRYAAMLRRDAGLPRPETRGDEMRRRYQAGERPSDIARSMGVGPSNVSQAIRRLKN
jgi:hypothetical protein